jgi:uncharacterized protein YbjT (DUF2867 family)
MKFTPIEQRSPIMPYTFEPPAGSTRTVLVVGASGRLGRQVVRALKRRGHRVRALSRDPARLAPVAGEIDARYRGDLTQPESLVSGCAGADVVICCAGAPLCPYEEASEPRFADVDLRGAVNLLRIAREAEVSRFVCIAPFAPERFEGTEYGYAREQFVELALESGVPCTVIRPTLMFGLCASIFPLVAGGRRWLLGDADTPVNPIDERDVAELCVGAVTSDATVIEGGGPDTLTPRKMATAMLESLGVDSVPLELPSWGCRTAAAVARPFRPRAAALLELAAAATSGGAIAPELGRRSWSEYLANASGAANARVTPAYGGAVRAPWT